VRRTSVWATRRLALEAQIGAGAPLGFAGVALDVAPVRWLSLNAGAGTNGLGPQLAGMARLRYPLRLIGLGLGGGVSGGAYRWREAQPIDAEGQAVKRWYPAYWGNVEASVEARWRNGFLLRLGVGGSFLVNPEAGACTSEGDVEHCRADHRGDGGPLLYTNLAIGYAFRL
jgi:hypothetical protein